MAKEPKRIQRVVPIPVQFEITKPDGTVEVMDVNAQAVCDMPEGSTFNGWRIRYPKVASTAPAECCAPKKALLGSTIKIGGGDSEPIPVSEWNSILVAQGVLTVDEYRESLNQPPPDENSSYLQTR